MVGNILHVYVIARYWFEMMKGSLYLTTSLGKKLNLQLDAPVLLRSLRRIRASIKTLAR